MSAVVDTGPAMPHATALPGRAAIYGLLVVLCLALFTPGFFSVPPTDRDEARFAQATQQMLESGDYVDIRFQDEARHKKPVGIYWLQSATVALAGGPDQAGIWAYRLPSLTGATLAVLLTAWIGMTLFGTTVGVLGAVMTAGTILLGVEARMAKTDAMLLASILAAQAVLARAWMERTADAAGVRVLSWPYVALFWGALGFGILLKGPIILLVAGGTALVLSVFERQAGWLRVLRPLPGLLIMLAIVAPWLVLITLKTQGAFFAESVGHDLLGKVAGGQESKGFPPGYYTLLFPVTFWPYSLLALPAIPWVWARRHDAAVRFALAWIIPTWLVFEAVPTKLFHYVLPVYPAIALLTAQAALDGFGKARPWLFAVAAGLFGLLALGLAGGMVALPWAAEQRIDPLAIGIAVPVLAVLAIGGVLAWRGQVRLSVAALTAGAAGLYVLAFQHVFPQLQTIWLSPRIAEVVAETRPCPDTVLASAGYTEPSLVFLVGTETLLTGEGARAADHLAGDACALALVDSAQDPAFRARLAEAGVEPVPLRTISGFNYSKGKRLDLTLYRRP